MMRHGILVLTHVIAALVGALAGALVTALYFGSLNVLSMPSGATPTLFVLPTTVAQAVESPQPTTQEINPTETAAAPTLTAVLPSPIPNTITPQGPSFFDDFGSGIGPAWQTPTGEWTTANGQASPITTGIIVTGDQNWQNFALDLDFQIAEQGADAWILFSYQDDRHFRLLALNASDGPQPFSELADYNRLIAYSVVPNTHVDNSFIPDQMQHLRMEFRDRSVTVYIDGKLITSAGFDAVVTGPIGIEAEGFRDLVSPVFDNFEVSPLP